ncbi:MAG: FtsX-like permease family protein [Candidatus Aminicenantes bacterium]|nr:FtsX-like permease family protein [Candidatus Aminicenantes bacterium]
MYKSEERFERIFLYFSLLAIAVALLGLFSLSAYSAQQKAKEIGIRKVLGATVPNILALFSREMVFLIALSASLAAAFITISYQSLKAAFKKPVDELRVTYLF